MHRLFWICPSSFKFLVLNWLKVKIHGRKYQHRMNYIFHWWLSHQWIQCNDSRIDFILDFSVTISFLNTTKRVFISVKDSLFHLIAISPINALFERIQRTDAAICYSMFNYRRMVIFWSQSIRQLYFSLLSLLPRSLASLFILLHSLSLLILFLVN